MFLDHQDSFADRHLKDVLDNEIVGTSCSSRLRRWWHDLFLLSYKCDRFKGFYRSSNALRADRFKQFHKYKHRIHPLSKFRTFWNFLILHVLVVNKIILRFTSTFLFVKLPLTLFYVGAVLELITIVDLYVSLKTGYINTSTKQVVLDAKKTMINFCATKLFLHVASATPLHWLMFLRYGRNINCGLCKCNRYICALKIISLISLLRIIESSSCWCWRQQSKVKDCLLKFTRIAIVAFVTMIQLYDLGDVLCLLIFISENHVVQISTLAIRTGLVYNPHNNTISNYNMLGYDLGRMMHSLLHFSYAFSIEVYYLDRMTAFIAYITANFFYCWSLLQCFRLVNAIFFLSDQKIRFKAKVINYLHANRLPNSMCTQVAECFNYRSAIINLIETRNGLYRTLPETLKNEIKLSCNLNIILRLPLFTEWPVSVIENMAIMLQRKVYLTNDVVTTAKTQSEGLMIVHDGVLAVYSDLHEELGHLIDGDFFGALSLVTDREIGMSYVVAATNCTILFLSKRDFRRYMQNHPQLFYTFKMDVKAKSKPIFNSNWKAEGEGSSTSTQN